MKPRLSSLPLKAFRTELARLQAPAFDLMAELGKYTTSIFERTPEENLARMADFVQKQEIRNAIRNQEILDSETDFIADGAWMCWSKGDLRFFLNESGVWRETEQLRIERPEVYKRIYVDGPCKNDWGRFNGYVRFPKLPLIAPGRGGIAAYVPVHGGITFFQEWWDGSCTYGFDTGHLVSSENPEIINDINWLMAEAESLGRGLQIAARFEPYYLRAGDDNEKKARVLDRLNKFTPITMFNMDVMMNLLSGEL